jgi:plastocyanin
MKKLLVPLVILGACSLLLGLQSRPRQHVVEIDGMQYSPSRVTITAGETVVWRNVDQRDHTVRCEQGSFDSGTIRPGETFQHRFTRAGTYPYCCGFHPRMKGTVIVERRSQRLP